MRHRILLALVLLVAFAAQAGLAQDRAITGVVVDSSSNKPLVGATVYVGLEAAGNPTVKDGKFSVDKAGPGDLVVVHRAGYVPRPIAVPEGSGSVDLGAVRMRQAKSTEDRAAVDAEDLRVHPFLADYHRRKAELTAGVFYNQEDIEVTGTRNLTEVIRRMPGFRIACIVDRQDQWDCGEDTKRGTTYSGFRSSDTRCATAFWTTAGRLHSSAEEILTEDVAAIEAYAQPGSTPADFSGSRCGTVVVWMRHKTP